MGALPMAMLPLVLPFMLLLLASTNFAQHEGILPGIRMPSNFQTVAHSAPEAAYDESAIGPNCNGRLACLPRMPMRVSMKHRDDHPLHRNKTKTESFHHAIRSDSHRLHRAQSKLIYASVLKSSPDVAEMKGSSPRIIQSPSSAPPPLISAAFVPDHSNHISSHVESGITLGSGEYFVEVYMGTPPKLFYLIIDTGSDLIWTQCNPCKRCYKQQGPIFSPNASSSYKLLTCSHPQCMFVYNNDSCATDQFQTCTYSYWYGDTSNTTGDLALETVTFTLDNGQRFSLDGIIFGCGHSNQGLFTGAGGLLGLGKGSLSFPSQMRDRFAHKFSYCLVNRNTNLSVSSSLTFGEDEALVNHPHIQYTRFINYSSTDTYYYLAIKSISVGGEELEIPSTVWALGGKDEYGAIIDSGTTLTYFVKPAYEKIVLAFDSKISYPKVNSSTLNYCYNLSSYEEANFPTFSIAFDDGAVFSPPVENYFIEIDSISPVYCIAIMEAPAMLPTILGNSLQQNIHFLYDLDSNRLGFAPMECSSMG